jgi:hypothetical protein
MGINDVERVDAVTESQEPVSETEPVNETSEQGDMTVSEGTEEKTEETPEIDLENPKIKAFIESLADKKAQGLKDKRIDTTIKELNEKLTAKEREAAELKAGQEKDAKRIREEAQFHASLEQAKREMEESGASESQVATFIKKQQDFHEWQKTMQARAEDFYKAEDSVKAQQTRYDAIEAVAEEYPELPYAQVVKLANEVMEKAEEKNKTGFRLHTLKYKLSESSKPKPKPKEPQKLDSGGSHGSSPVFSRKAIANMSDAEYAKNRDKIFEAQSRGQVN